MTAVPDTVATAALAAADQMDPGGPLRTDVLAALHSSERTAERYNDIVDIAALIVSIATLAWTVTVNLRAKTEKPKADAVARRVRVEFPLADNISPEQRDLVIDVVVDRILAEDEEQ
jgi:predicted metal-binding membrane protein